MSVLIAALVPVFGLIIMGYLLKRWNSPGEGFWPLAACPMPEQASVFFHQSCREMKGRCHDRLFTATDTQLTCQFLPPGNALPNFTQNGFGFGLLQLQKIDHAEGEIVVETVVIVRYVQVESLSRCYGIDIEGGR